MSVEGVEEPAGANCPAGGVAYTSADRVRYVCNGVAGTPGAAGPRGASCSVVDAGNGTRTITCEDGTAVVVRDGASVTGTVEAPGPNCADGGIVLSGVGGPLYVCNGAPGLAGSQGAPGEPGPPGPAGPPAPVAPASSLIYARSWVSLFGAGGPLPARTTVGPWVADTFPLTIPATGGTVLFRMESPGFGYECDHGDGIDRAGYVRLEIADAATGAWVGAFGMQLCSPQFATPCDRGFSLNGVIESGRLAPGNYVASIAVGPACATTMLPGYFSVGIGIANFSAVLYDG